MDIESLTIGEARKIAALFTSKEEVKMHPATGQYVIVRCYSAGVHAGVLSDALNGEVTLNKSRRLWSWTGALSCSEIAMTGITGGKIAVEVPVQYLSGVIEIIPATSKAQICLQTLN